MLGLVSDIGGTNARIAIVRDLEVEILKTYPTGNFGSALELFNRFKKDAGIRLPSRWAIAAAGVSTEERIRGTNIGWDIVKDDLVASYRLETCLLLNDFEAAAYGLAFAGGESLQRLGGEEPKVQGTKILLGAGTGLGEATCVFCEKAGWKVIRSEGGHASFAPMDETEDRLLEFLREKYEHVSYERILSGSGILDLYSFFSRHGGLHLSRNITEPSQVTYGAKTGDEVCKKTIDLFCKIYGEEAGNFALKTFPEGGVYLAGGVTLHLVQRLEDGLFRKGFEAKGRMERLLKDIPVFIVKEPYIGILGSAYRLLHTCVAKTA